MNIVLTPSLAAELITDVGFLHVPGPAVDRGSAYLLVAIRARPTLRHFDPERCDLWLTENGRGQRHSINRSSPTQQTTYAWGRISLVDRLGVANHYLSFGGRLSAERISGMLVLVLASTAPIFAAGGHSETWDPLAPAVAGFFARLRATAARGRQQETLFGSLSPMAMYATFVADYLARYDSSERMSSWRPATISLLQHGAVWLRETSPSEWAAGAAVAAGMRGVAR